MTISWFEEDSSFQASLAALVDLLVVEESLPTVLERVVALACAGVGECDLASITTQHEDEFQTIAQTDQIAVTIDHAQYAADSGPCIDAFRQRAVVSVPSMADGDAWPAFRSAAIAHGVRSSFSLPMVAGEDQRMGALNLYARRDHAFNSVPPAAALLFAKQAAGAVWAARTHERTRDVIEHLETALSTRDVIGMAKGIVMTNEKVTSDDAFAVLVSASQRRNIKLREIAAEVVATGSTPH
jgi:GAF domain-containing protein